MLIDGKKETKKHRAIIKQEVEKLTKIIGRPPSLDVILIGNDAASIIYTKNKEQSAKRLGICGKLIHYNNIREHELIEIIKELNYCNNVDGILVQLPLPDHIDTQKVINTINKFKDVDCFTPYNIGLLTTQKQYFLPCTPKACLYLLHTTGEDLAGKHAVIINHSNIVGRPLSQLLLNHNVTVTIAHKSTNNLCNITTQADILISATGVAHLIKREYVKPGAIVLDVGISRINNKIYGDVDFNNVKDITSWITPVPGGVGPMTISCLLENTLIAAKLNYECK